jgi:hypothetical protein
MQQSAIKMRVLPLQREEKYRSVDISRHTS